MSGVFIILKPHQFRIQLILLTLLTSVVSKLADSAEIQLPVFRLPFVAPSDSASAAVSSFQVFGQDRSFSIGNSSLTAGRPDEAYCLQLSIGTPGQNVTAVLDTGSADFVVAGASAPSLTRWFQAEVSSSLSWQQQLVRRPYTAGFWEGHLAQDVVAAAGATPVRAAFTVAERSSAFFDAGGGGVWQASVGLAFDRIASARALGGVNFADALARQAPQLGQDGGQQLAVFAMQLCAGDAAGRGGASFFSVGRGNRTGMVYAAVRYGWFYEVVIVDVKLGDFSLGLDCKEFNFERAIVDSGIGDIRLPASAHARISQQLRMQQPQLGNQFFSGASLLCADRSAGANATAQLLAAFPFITFSLLASENETVDLSLSPAQYLRQVPGGVPGNQTCFRFGLQSSKSGAVLGSSFMSGFLVEFDRSRNRLGFAPSSCSSGRGGLGPRVSRGAATIVQGGPWDCAFFRADPDESSAVLRPAAIVMATVCVACVLPVCALLVWQHRERRCRDGAEDGETVQLVQT